MMLAFMITSAGATILSAVILAIAGIVVALVQQVRTQRKVSEVHDALKTNHGKRPGEYLEMVGDLAEQVTRLDRKVDTVAGTLADHTVADAVNFEEQRKRQLQMDVRIAANAEAAVLAVNAAGRANMVAKGYHDDVMAEIQATKKILCEGPDSPGKPQPINHPTE